MALPRNRMRNGVALCDGSRPDAGSGQKPRTHVHHIQVPAGRGSIPRFTTGRTRCRRAEGDNFPGIAARRVPSAAAARLHRVRASQRLATNLSRHLGLGGRGLAGRGLGARGLGGCGLGGHGFGARGFAERGLGGCGLGMFELSAVPTPRPAARARHEILGADLLADRAIRPVVVDAGSVSTIWTNVPLLRHLPAASATASRPWDDPALLPEPTQRTVRVSTDRLAASAPALAART
jgi:hypothetical protein